MKPCFLFLVHYFFLYSCNLRNFKSNKQLKTKPKRKRKGGKTRKELDRREVKSFLFAMEIASSIVGEVVELAVDSVVRLLGYLFCYSRSIKDFKKVSSLKITTNDRELQVKEASDKGGSILEAVTVWLNQVEKIPKGSEKFINEEIDAIRKCIDECAQICGTVAMLEERLRRRQKL